MRSERGHPAANIVDFGDAVWWSSATITGVGYGDLYPVTGMGRLIGVLLMIGGISLIGVVTGSVATWIGHRVAEGDVANRTSTDAQISDLRSEVRRLTQLVGAGFDEQREK